MAAFINAIAEEGTKAEAVEWLQKTWDENCELRAEIERLRADGWELIYQTEPNDDDGSGNADRDGFEFMVRTYRRKKAALKDTTP